MKISLIIPTRERASLFEHCVKTALSIEDDNLEIVVCDNCSHDATPEITARITDPRVVKLRSNKRLSMRQNFESGLTHATGDYVCFIGDDDGFLPKQFPFARRLLQQYAPDTMAYSLLRYAWPGAGKKSKEGTLRLERPRLYGLPRAIDLDDMRDRVLSARVNWFEGWPDIYHGFVSRSYIESRRRPGSDFFQSRAPDIYFSYLALLTGSKHLFVPHSFTISGFSTSSTGGSAQQTANLGLFESPAVQFEREAAEDPIRDRVNLGFGVPAGLFSTILEVTRQVGDRQPNFEFWFNYVIRSADQMAEHHRQTVIDRLRDFVDAEGLTNEWKRANSTTAKIKRRFFRLTPTNLSQVVIKARNKFESVRVSARQYNDLTIAGAVRAVDYSLSDSYDHVLAGTLPSSLAWTGMRQRIVSTH